MFKFRFSLTVDVITIAVTHGATSATLLLLFIVIIIVILLVLLLFFNCYQYRTYHDTYSGLRLS